MLASYFPAKGSFMPQKHPSFWLSVMAAAHSQREQPFFPHSIHPRDPDESPNQIMEYPLRSTLQRSFNGRYSYIEISDLSKPIRTCAPLKTTRYHVVKCKDYIMSCCEVDFSRCMENAYEQSVWMGLQPLVGGSEIILWQESQLLTAIAPFDWLINLGFQRTSRSPVSRKGTGSSCITEITTVWSK